MVLLISAVSCKKKDNTIIYGYHYFPVDEGHYVIYDVLDVFHDSALIPAHDTSRYQIKEVIGEAFIDEVGDTARKLRRYIRDNDTLSWTIKDVWSIKRSSKRAEEVEENQRRIKMAFAISYDEQWDGNALNNDDPETYYYRNIYKPVSIAGIDYDSSVVVEHHDFTSYIEYIRSYDIYAPHIGKIYSVNKNLQIAEYDTLNIHYGSEFTYSAVSWGTE